MAGIREAGCKVYVHQVGGEDWGEGCVEFVGKKKRRFAYG